MNQDANYDEDLATAWTAEVVQALGCSEEKALELLDAADWDIAEALRMGEA